MELLGETGRSRARLGELAGVGERGGFFLAVGQG